MSTSPTKPLLGDRTTTRLFNADGELLRESPTLILSSDDAALVRRYFATLLANRLEPELFCVTCGTERRDQQAQFTIDDDTIAVTCGCRTLFHRGRSAPQAILPVHFTVTDDPTSTITRLDITEAGARLFRQWKTFLAARGLCEGLRCNVCWDWNQPDGCSASVVSSSVTIRCRCARRTHTGMTI